MDHKDLRVENCLYISLTTIHFLGFFHRTVSNLFFVPCLLRDSENEELYEYCYFTIGGRFCHVSDDIGSLVSLKFLFGLVNQRFSFSSVCNYC